MGGMKFNEQATSFAAKLNASNQTFAAGFRSVTVLGGSSSPGGSSARIADIILLAANWVGSESPYSQVVTVEGVTPYSQVDLTPSVDQLTIFHEKDIAFVTENENGVVTVYAIGDKPLNDYTMQVTIKEVIV